MSVDGSRREVWRQMQRERGRVVAEPEGALNGGGGGDNSGGMEARIARLEAAMDFVKAELGKLSGLPAEVVRLSERVNHMPTRFEVRADIDAAVDRAAARTQRTIAVAGGLVTLAIAAMNYLPKLLG